MSSCTRVGVGGENRDFLFFSSYQLKFVEVRSAFPENFSKG